MLKATFWQALFLAAASVSIVAQVLSFRTSGDSFNGAGTMTPLATAQMNFDLFTINTQNPNGTPFQTPSGSVSKLDLKAPSKAQHEYDKGYQLLARKDLQGAVEHLAIATGIYPSYVAAHNALGTAYLDLKQNEQARDEFKKAVTLDDHLPNSFLNLGIAQLALKDNAGAEESLQKASSLAPLDLQLSMASAYGAFMNHDYPAVIATAKDVHGRKHAKAAEVHLLAAGALDLQGKDSEAQGEMEILLQEMPKSPSADQYRQLLETMKAQAAIRAETKLHPPPAVTFSFDTPAGPTSEEATRHAQKVLQDVKERSQIAEAEAAGDAVCDNCDAGAPATPAGGGTGTGTILRHPTSAAGPIFRSTVDEVAVFFAATDHGKSVTNLEPSDVGIRDDNRAPEVIRGFRNESQLPLRLGLVIDTSNSITQRFSFEQAAAIKFLQKVVTNKDDIAFVVGVNNSVLLVQDFTSDPMLTSRAVNQLAPGGGTALWDAVVFGAEKLAARPEAQPVARILVVISDGEDNSSSSTLKEAIGAALRKEVAVYTVSTREAYDDGLTLTMTDVPDLGDRALRTLSELTGGAAFAPGSLRRLNGSLSDLQEVIRGRYLVSYKPASFQPDGKYRPIELTAQKDGHKLKVFARKGYYASVAQPSTASQ